MFDESRGCRRVLLEITRRNFKCECCHASGLLPLWGVCDHQRLTDRLVRHVEQVSLLQPFAEVALTTGLSERKVRQVFDAHVRHLKKRERKAKMCYATMLRKRWSTLKEHQRDYLEKWFNEHPVLRTAYLAKEDFCRMWESGSAADAKLYYGEWSRQFAETARETKEQTDLRKDFEVIMSPMTHRGQQIYNYFDLDQKMTNAFTEWSNRRIRDVRRESRGCSVQVMRAKVIFGTWLKQRLKEGSQKWGVKTVMPKRTRRPSEPKKGVGAQELKRTRKPARPRRIALGQLSLFEW